MSSSVLISPPPTELKLAWPCRYARRIAQIGTGHLLYATTGWALDNVLYVWVVYQLGLLKGGLLMGSCATAYCAIMLVMYQRMKIDWVGAGSIDRLMEGEGGAWWRRAFRHAHRKGGWAIFTLLSVWQDPFITTAYYRQGRFGALGARDWEVFFCSAVVCNTWWTLRSGAVGAVVIVGWKHFTS